MDSNLDWLQILGQCKENVKNHIHPLLRNLKEPQPDLGTGAGGDKMKPADLAAEKAIVEVMLQHGVSFTLVSEESGIKEYGDKAGECFVTTDPIDGTTNLIRGLPFYCSSIAVSHRQQLSDVFAGMVTDLHHGTTYTAVSGKGAYRDGRRMETSKTDSLVDALIGLDINTYQGKVVVPKVAGLIEKTKHIRHFGANALEICYVANGLTDAFIDIRGKIRTTDVAAGFLILKEANGIVTTADNKAINVPLDPKQTLNFIASANSEIHKQILGLVKP